MGIEDVLQATFKGQQYTPELQGETATFYYPCLESDICFPISIFLLKGRYRFELWGANGGDGREVNVQDINEDSGGKGAFVSGILTINEPHTFHLFIGGKGEDQTSKDQSVYSKGGFNGGGKGGNEISGETDFPESSAGGGGATDIRLLNDTSNEGLKSRIIVAGGGGGACSTGGQNGYSYDYRGGHGGELEAISFNVLTIGGTQTQGNFGKGSDGLSFSSTKLRPKNGGSTGGAGGGYYGGSHISYEEIYENIEVCEVGGAGGSSYISGYPLCDSVSYLPYGQINHTGRSLHYSKLLFKSPVMKSGDKLSSSDNEMKKSGNGAIRITRLSPVELSYRCSNRNHISFMLFITIQN